MSRFVHLHVHTEYSTLDGASKIDVLIKKAQSDGMKAIAITDHGNMFGVKDFFNQVRKANSKSGPEKQLKPILGCEMYVAANSRFDKKGKENSSGDHLILLAKNITGYHNLIKLVSLGWLEGFYYKPRIDKELLEKYHEGLIASSACLGGEVPQYIRNDEPEKAEEAVLWYKNLFGEDYYLEIQRHPSQEALFGEDVFPQQQKVNEVLVPMARKHGIKVIATNDVHFSHKEDAEAHDRLLCLNTNANLTDVKRMRYTKQEWFKTQAEMDRLFPDLPEALTNTLEIADKVELYNIDSPAVMPHFLLPEGFSSDAEYLCHITWEGAANRYGTLTDETKDRIQFELDVICNMGYPGYFLIVQDFIQAARDMGVAVGPGRGSAAGSVVAYCLRITDIDPLKYDLLFERFLNPERGSLPDIDIDFDDDGRAQVLRWVTEKYGRDKVANIVTFGTMATKSSIKDVARVQQVPLSEADRLTKLIPDRLPDKNGKPQKISIANCIEYVPELKDALMGSDPLIADTLKYAQMLEGTVRQTGVHACGVIIGRDDLTDFIPISTAYDKATDTHVPVCQYEGSLIEEVGMLKMDFLGLKTLSIIKECVENIKRTKGLTIDISTIPIDDPKTYELYSKGDTTGTFQFESAGMKQYLRDLKPTSFEDLIAMNALYRPGPMAYIPEFIDRKHGRQPIVYDIPIMERYLKETHGIAVYQEQVMLLSRLLANFTRGQSDELRKAMGKKLQDKMDALKVKFIEGCLANGYEEQIILKIWDDWAKFAEYAFNKSHATCYSWVAYQTAWLKANYPQEYMAACLSRNISDITEIGKFMDECKRMGIDVLGPDVNESHMKFTVNKKGAIRFGMGAIKGVGEAAVQAILDERTQNGPFLGIFDFVERVNLQACSRKTVEALAQAGGFDTFPEISREQFFVTGNKEESFCEVLIRYGNKMQIDKSMAQNTLFGGVHSVDVARPDIPWTEPWSMTEKLKLEKELIGMYLSAHPLDPYKFEIRHFTNHTMQDFTNLSSMREKEFVVAGMVTKIRQGVSQKTQKPYGSFTVEDYSGSYEFTLFGKDYEANLSFFRIGWALMIRGLVQPRQYRNNEWEAKIKKISLLANAREDLLKSISLVIKLPALTNEVLAEIMDMTKASEGNTLLKCIIIDPEDRIQVDMFSRKHQVQVDDLLLERLSGIPGIEYRIN